MDGGRRSHVERAIAPGEAAVVERIFTLAAHGWGVKRIASTLNTEAAPAPTPRRAGRPRGWAPSSVREILAREVYRGVLVWNRSRKRDSWGQKRQRPRDESEWLRVETPALRIVSDELWQAAHAQLDGRRALYLATNKGRAFGRPASGVESPYLLTGLGTCGVCGGSMCVLTRSHGHQRVPFWGCMVRKQRGQAVCPNTLEVPLAATDHAVLKSVEHDLLNVAAVETALFKAMASFRPPDEVVESAERALREELALLSAEVDRLAAAIAAGGNLPALLALLQERERRRAHVRAELAGVERERAAGAHNGFHAGRVLDELRDQLTDWQGMLRQQPGPARQALGALLQGRLIFLPEEWNGERFYTFSGEGTVTPVIAGTASLQHVWCPRRDSNPCCQIENLES